ncbi:MAG TPA: TrpB-like pyridoxal phosphate-dependent enzyme [Methylomusa anaerophila]|uniref:Tryptophan synthase beta chain n=1 Tax=Methylomusa anaerophila TaxID=1930071 RepID=A0A348AEK9_9FIRM|nr:TrpB-like pyridoxal phosphate-dependent enzyme [Methylomusa anaerophila]BBB89507.1 tryptophan synthase beta chain [Methylomusa anaerophila]HML90123.1 TrpB-like pyridoxal phosphate-dependent enzyme [Methylomusa anaerophila]
MKSDKKIVLSESEIPRQWYNIQADMPCKLEPPLHPTTKRPVTPEDLSPIFPLELIKQEASVERWIDIPQEIIDKYRIWRPTPVIRAYELEKALDTPAKIYYKYEGASPAGSHKANTSVPQAYYNKTAGIKRLATETGAGQWGSALSLACSFYDMECTVYMVKISYNQKPYRRSFMQIYGAEVIASPSDRTQAGRDMLALDPDSLGSLGLAISEAVEDASSRPDTNYALGSVLNHVILHQTVIGLETQKQLEKVGEYPDVVVGCCGGGSNFAGLAFPFLKDKFTGTNIRAVAVEPTACPTLTRGVFAYDYGDLGKLTPITKMYTLGHNFMPPGIHAGGLRYHGESPLVSQLYHNGFIEAQAYHQTEVFEAAVLFAKSEGIIPAPESSHAIKGAIVEALKAKEEGRSKTILFCLSGHGHFDMTAYDNYISGKMEVPGDEQPLQANMISLPEI